MKKNKKGFTMMELIVAICVFVFIILIVMPIFRDATDSSVSKTHTIFVQNIKEGAHLYVEEYNNSIPWVTSNENANEVVSCIHLSEIQSKGFFTGELIDPATNENYDETKMVKATKDVELKTVSYELVNNDECEEYTLDLVLNNPTYGSTSNPLNYKDTYVEYGATATFAGLDMSDKVEISYTNLSEGAALTVLSDSYYTVTYKISLTNDFGTFDREIVRYVSVADLTAPTMTLNGSSELVVVMGTEYVDAGVTVSDNYDSESVLRSRLVINNPVDVNVGGTYTITYDLTDSSGNRAQTLKRTVRVVDELEEIIKEKDDCIEEEDGCWPTPTETDNYVLYSGILWRYYKVNDDGSIKIIANTSVGNRRFIINYCRGCCNAGTFYILNFASSYINNSYSGMGMNWYLNNDFYASLNSPTTYLTNASFCQYVDTCEEVTTYVSLITYGEYTKFQNGGNNFLNNGTNWWTMTSDKSQKKGYYVDSTGATVLNRNSSLGTRPVVVLKTGTKILGGNGTIDNPYLID